VEYDWVERAEGLVRGYGKDDPEVREGAEALLRHSDTLVGLPPDVCKELTSAWLGRVFLHVMDDELKFDQWSTTASKFEHILEFVSANIDKPIMAIPESVRGIVKAVVSPRISLDAVIDVQLGVAREWRPEAAPLGIKLANNELTEFGDLFCLDAAFERDDQSRCWEELMHILHMCSLRGYGLRGGYPARGEVTLKVYDTCRANYADSEAHQFLAGTIRNELEPGNYKGCKIKNFDYLIDLLNRRIRPTDRLVREVQRIQDVQPTSLAEEMLSEVANFDVFVSHMGADKPFARLLSETLQERDMSVWLDEWVMAPGDVLSRQIAAGIESSRFFVVLLSAEALKRDWVVYELDLALVRQVENRNRFIIPILLDATDPPFFLRHILYHRVSADDDMHGICDMIFPHR
jgi:TIR domain-containing protein